MDTGQVLYGPCNVDLFASRLNFQFANYCTSVGYRHAAATNAFFLEFLTELFDSGLQHRTINVVCSAVSMTHEKVERVPIGKHPPVTRLMKGVYNLGPPKLCALTEIVERASD
jgi:hypothetical protein